MQPNANAILTPIPLYDIFSTKIKIILNKISFANIFLSINRNKIGRDVVFYFSEQTTLSCFLRRNAHFRLRGQSQCWARVRPAALSLTQLNIT